MTNLVDWIYKRPQAPAVDRTPHRTASEIHLVNDLSGSLLLEEDGKERVGATFMPRTRLLSLERWALVYQTQKWR